MQYADDDMIRQRIATALNDGMSRKQAARWLGISEPKLSQYLNRTRPHASRVMLRRLNYGDTRYYRRAEKTPA
jgi:predicted transcriptional regulator